MACTIGSGKIDFISIFGYPVKIATYNIPWFVKDIVIIKRFIEMVIHRKHCFLNPAGIGYTVGDIFFLSQNFIALDFKLIALRNNLFFLFLYFNSSFFYFLF